MMGTLLPWSLLLLVLLVAIQPAIAMDCGGLSDPANGQVSVIGSLATYSCNIGFSLMGVQTRTCQSNGTWSGQPPVCTSMDCGSLTRPMNGQVTLTGTTLGSTATYSCDQGYDLTGVSMRTCQSDGMWSDQLPVCTWQQSCTSGFISRSDLTTLAPTCNIACEHHHEQRLIPDINFTCGGIITRWIFGAGFDSGESYVPAELQLWRLQAGTYIKVGNCSIQNTASENSDRVYECIPSSQLRFEAGDVLGIFQPRGRDSRLSVYFESGHGHPTNYYEVADTAAARFDITGTTTSDVALPLVTVEILVDCGNLTDPENGQVTLSGTIEGSTANYSCNTGSSLMGVSMRTCQSDGMWSDQPPVCTLVDCGSLTEPDNGQVTLTGTTEGSTANYSCNTGYSLMGVSMRTCQSDGMWSDQPPVCTLVDCGNLTDPENGQVTLTGTTEGSTATYSCDTGYSLMGVSMRTCQSDGMWSDQPPVCTLVDCGNLTDPENGQVTLTGTTEGSTATYSCDTGYSLMGVSMRTCQSDRMWSDQPPVCTLVDCGNLTDPENGQVTLSGTTEGSTATYSCNIGYSLMGVSMRTCKSNGTWSEQPPVCTHSRETGIGLKVIIIIVAATVITLLLLLLFISILIVGIRRKRLLAERKLQNALPQLDQEDTDLHSSCMYSEILSDGSTTQLIGNTGTSYASKTSSFVDKVCHQDSSDLAGALEAYFAPNYCTMPRCEEDPPLDITNSNILELRELGTGQFSQVVLARTVGLSPKDLKLSPTDDDKTKSLLVAVKKLKPNATQEQREVFENECKLMARLKDNNVVHFMGVCQSNTPFIVMEYMENGDLNHYLQRFASVIPIPTIHPLHNGQITTSALLYMSTQIASAMKYLASCNIVHRDLAARNCLIGQDYLVKLADFGLSRNLYQSHCYHLHGHAILPIRWMASECFRGKFSQKSDVWAFGVTMWEMYTLAKQQPYHKLNNEEVMQDARRGVKRSLLTRPSACPTDVYEVMLKCWHHDRHKRATFEEIHALLLAAREYDIVAVEESYGASLHSELVSGDKFVPSKLQLTSDSAKSYEALTQYEDVQRYQAVQEYETVQQYQTIQQDQHQRAEKVRHYQTVQHYEKVRHYQTVQQYEEVQPYQRVQQYEEVQPYQRVQQYEEVQPYQRVQQYERVQPYETIAQHKPHLRDTHPAQ